MQIIGRLAVSPRRRRSANRRSEAIAAFDSKKSSRGRMRMRRAKHFQLEPVPQKVQLRLHLVAVVAGGVRPVAPFHCPLALSTCLVEEVAHPITRHKGSVDLVLELSPREDACDEGQDLCDRAPPSVCRLGKCRRPPQFDFAACPVPDRLAVRLGSTLHRIINHAEM